MKKILLLSDKEWLFEKTHLIVGKKNKLIWYTYNCLKKNIYPHVDVDIVIMHFDKELVNRDAFEMIVKVKGKLGHSIPILALIEDVTRQEIFSILKIGVYDYMEITNNPQNYEKKINELFMWSWYLNKYKSEIRQQ